MNWTIIYTKHCSKCPFIKKEVSKIAKEKNIPYQEIDFDIIWDAEIKDNILTIPTLIVDDWKTRKYLTDEDIFTFIKS